MESLPSGTPPERASPPSPAIHPHPDRRQAAALRDPTRPVQQYLYPTAGEPFQFDRLSICNIPESHSHRDCPVHIERVLCRNNSRSRGAFGLGRYRRNESNPIPFFSKASEQPPIVSGSCRRFLFSATLYHCFGTLSRQWDIRPPIP